MSHNKKYKENLVLKYIVQINNLIIRWIYNHFEVPNIVQLINI